jgi:hypothetical protein
MQEQLAWTYSLTLMLETIIFSEILLDLYTKTWCYIPDNHTSHDHMI